jgi:hypothetical protein
MLALILYDYRGDVIKGFTVGAAVLCEALPNVCVGHASPGRHSRDRLARVMRAREIH